LLERDKQNVKSRNIRLVSFVSKTDIFVLAQLVFPGGVDVWVVEKDGAIYAGGQHDFHDFARAGCSARAQQHLVLPVWPGQPGTGKLVLHDVDVRCRHDE